MKKLLVVLLIITNIFATKYYSSHNASGGGAGTTGDPYTLQELFDNTDAGDTGYVMATGTYTPSAVVDVDNASAATANNPALIRGASATGVDNGTMPVISGSSLPATTNLLNLNVASLSVRFENLRITNATNYNVILSSSLGGCAVTFDSCRIDHGNSNGVRIENSTTSAVYVFSHCLIDSNGGDGIGINADGRGGCKIFFCNISYNDGDGVEDDANSTTPKQMYVGNVIYKNGAAGIKLRTTGSGCTFLSNVFFANVDAINISSNAVMKSLVIMNNIFRSNTGYALNTNTGSFGIFVAADYNCYSNNTTGDIDINSDTPPGHNNVTSDPLFTNETIGSEDFTLQSSSPCKNTGFNTYGY